MNIAAYCGDTAITFKYCSYLEWREMQRFNIL